MQIIRNTGLVLEGGGMRGVFTSGVLDAFMKHEVYFNYVVAVSAGACNGLSYMSRQPRRARISNIDMLAKYDYIGLRHLFTQGSIFDPELLYERFPNEIVPYDYDTFFSSKATFEMVVTNCLTGQPEYLSEHSGNRQRLIDIARASSSLPYVSKIVKVDGVPMLDGGIIDSIPVMRAVHQGFVKNVQGRGCFVLGSGSELMKEQLICKVENSLTEAIKAAKIANLSNEELHHLLDILLEANTDD